MNASKLRQEIGLLNKERSKLLDRVIRPGRMVKGSLYQMGRSCGNPNCKCCKYAKKHVSWYLSRGMEGKTKLTYVGRIVPSWLADSVKRYQHHQKLLARIRKADARISDGLNQLRDAMVQTIEEARRKHQ
ncbi:MAG: hypothetical protein DDT27_01426 [Dehalococcoidia bacterium]|nr:hypothetical protein [Chloroflexota bacterium]MBT9162861.1 hypothetical protein [Chloroflexota bacterium]